MGNDLAGANPVWAIGYFRCSDLRVGSGVRRNDGVTMVINVIVLRIGLACHYDLRVQRHCE